MPRKLCAALIALLLCSAMAGAQEANTWAKWKWLMGDWKGSGGGQPGQGIGTFSFHTDLDEKILIRKSHSEYPAADKRPRVVHDDLMIIYADYTGTPTKAMYFDNEGHTLNYAIAYADSSIVMTSEAIQNTLTFRLSYQLLKGGKMNIKFEISQDGRTYSTYVEGVAEPRKN